MPKLSRLPRALVLAMVLGGAVVLSAVAQDQPPSRPDDRSAQGQPSTPATPMFRSDVSVIILDARVVDSEGRFVRDLTPEDFRIFEDDVEQDLTTFSLVEIPFDTSEERLLAGARVERDIVSNSSDTLGRMYVVVMNDQVHPLQAPTMRAIAREFVERHVTDLDRVALVSTSGRDEVTRQFTNNRQSLLTAIDKYEGGYGMESNVNVRRFLRAIVQWLGGFSGRRKALVLIGGISPTTGMDPAALPDDPDAMTIEASETRDIVNAAAQGNVSLYSIDHNGNPSAPSAGIKPIDVSGITSAFASSSARVRENPIPRFDADAADEVLADTTGGFALVRSNDFTGAFDRIVDENSSYYLLGYTPRDQRKDSRFRRIRIELRRPDLTVRARSGYTAATRASNLGGRSPADMPETLASAFQSPLPVAGLTLSVSAPVFRTSSQPAVDVIVEARGRDLLFTPSDARLDGAMQLVIAAAGNDGRVKGGERGDLTMRLSAGTHDAISQDGVRLLSRLALKPGKYQLRVAAVDSGGGPMRGAVQMDLDVPDFSKGGLTMSGIALARPGRPMVTRGADKEWLPRTGVPPTSQREFSAGEPLVSYVELYDNKRSTHQVEATVSLRRESGETVFQAARTFPITRGKEKAAVLRLLTPIPLANLTPGRYVLVIDAISSADRKKPASRLLPFSVR